MPVVLASRWGWLDAYIETAKANGLTPFDYLNWLFEEPPKQSKDIDDLLLPWMWKQV